MSLDEKSPMYISDKEGSDEAGDGSKQKPFKTLIQAMRASGKPFPRFLVASSKEGQRWEEVSQAQQKMVGDIYVTEQWKHTDVEKKEAEKAEKRECNLEEARKVTIEEDPSLSKGELLSKVMKVKSILIESFQQYFFFDKPYHQVCGLCKIKFEGGSALFKLKYFGEEVTLTQSRKFETAVPLIRDLYCLIPSYRREQSHLHTRPHFSEFTHVEGDCLFITFDDLLGRIEDLVCDVAERVMKTPEADYIKELHPNFVIPKRPFKRMDYADAIKYLKENDIKKEDGTYYEFGEDIPEMPERMMTDKMNEPILLCRFPASIMSSSIRKCPEDKRVTESVDLLMPNVGELVGGAIRMWDGDELRDGCMEEGNEATPYTDHGKYSTCSHGGYGLSLECFLMWLLNHDHIGDTCFYPRFNERCKP